MSFDLADFYHNESRLYGVDTLKRDLTASAEVLEALTPGFVAGDYRAAPITETCGLGEAHAAYRKVAAGSAAGSCCGRRNTERNPEQRLGKPPAAVDQRVRRLAPAQAPQPALQYVRANISVGVWLGDARSSAGGNPGSSPKGGADGRNRPV